MSAVARSAFLTSLTRYRRSWGLWLLLLVAPVAARYWIRPVDSDILVIAIDGRAPVLTSPVIGVSLGVVIATVLLPCAFIYLRSNATARQSWQIEEVTGASRISIALGRFGADAAVLSAVLVATTFAGLLIGWLLLPSGALDPAALALALWLVAAPALVGVAALRVLFDARPRLRGPWGDLLFFFLWMASLVFATVSATAPPGFMPGMTDYAGFLRPLTGGLPVGSTTSFAIGGSPGSGLAPIAIDVMRGLRSDGYVASRAAWTAIAVGVAALAGVVYAPHRPGPARRPGRFSRWLAPGPPRPANAQAPAASAARMPWLGLVAAEARLIARGRPWLIAAAAAALAGLFADFRTVASPAALLLLVFGLTAHAGRVEKRGLLALTATTRLGPMARRAAFVAAGAGWSLLIGLPGIARALASGDAAPLLIAGAGGVLVAGTAILLAALTRSAFAPRLLLLIAWYAYLSTG